VKCELYYINGSCHREGDKPNKIEYSKDGNIITEIWMRENGYTEVKRNVIDLDYMYNKLKEYNSKMTK